MREEGRELAQRARRALQAAACTLALVAGAAAANTFRFANQGDALSMDPHSLNESLQLNFTGNIYEPLVGRGKNLELVPLLATDWKQTAPTVWRFNLRKGVTFHDGTPFTADDVIFSWQRARGEGSDVKTYVQEIVEIRKIHDHAIDIVTRAPFPILPNVMTNWFIMSKKWCEENRAVQPVDKRKGVENTASFKANGTGPFRLRARDPGVRTTLVRNFNYWDKKIETNIEEAIFTPIANASTRVAALLSGEIDMMEPVPVQDIARIAANPNLKVMQGPELRTIFLGMDQGRDELLYSNVKGKNPFKDKRVRQAFYQAIDVNAIQKAVMRGASQPTALMIAPGIRGFPADLNKRLPYDPEAAKKLLAEAGYPNGFEVGMNCPNDRYVNDEEICKAVAAMLARIGIKVNLTAETKGTYFPKILSRNTSFYLLGWTPGTYDAHNPLNALMATPDPKTGRGQFNLGSYSNPRVDELTQAIASETDPAKRNAMIREAMKIHQDDIGHIPLHQQALAWAMKKSVNTVQLADNFMMLKWTTVGRKRND
ncbi:MAG: ABC transporter substrate-binding protein [Burkholderiaceae bacterium]|nr:ABC transporter substrate-binding protein [Burkholderiaceae bacterium]